MQKIKVLVVDDHAMLRNGLRSLLESDHKEHTYMVEEAGNGKEAIVKAKKSHYHIVLMDYKMPEMDGLETTKAMVEHNPDVNVLVISQFDEWYMINDVFKAGARGYMLKGDSDGLIRAINLILQGEIYYSTGVTKKLANEVRKTPSGEVLTEREHSVLNLLALRYNSKEIAKILRVTKHAIDKFRRQLLEKFQVKSAAKLNEMAMKLNFIDAKIY